MRGLSLEEDGTHSWPVSTRTRIFLPYFTWDPQKTKSSQIQGDELIGSGKFSKVFRTRLDNLQNCSTLDDSSRDTTDGPATNKVGHPEIGDSVAVKVMDKSVILSHPGVANQLNQVQLTHMIWGTKPFEGTHRINLQPRRLKRKDPFYLLRYNLSRLV